jgi:hypothetical protein
MAPAVERLNSMVTKQFRDAIVVSILLLYVTTTLKFALPGKVLVRRCKKNGQTVTS